MKRKVLKVGNASLAVSLPSKWVKEHGLKSGDEIELLEEGGEIKITKNGGLQEKVIKRDITELDRTSLIYLIQSLYRYGYDELELTFKKNKTIHYRTKKEIPFTKVLQYVCSRLVGYEIMSQKEGSCTIKYIGGEDSDDFTVILRRIFLMINETFQNLLKGFEKNDKEILAMIDEEHDNITKFISYCLRLLNKQGYENQRKSSIYYHIVAELDKVLDIIKYIGRGEADSNVKKYPPEVTRITTEVGKSLRMYYEIFYDFDMHRAAELNERRDVIKCEILSLKEKIPGHHLMILTRLEELLELLLDLTESRMALEN